MQVLVYSFCSFSASYLRKAQGDGILKMTAYFHTIYCTAMVMELMDMDLQTYCAGMPNCQLTLRGTLQVATQLSKACAHLYRRDILHRDIHMKNLLVTLDSPIRVVLTDFGWGTLSAAKHGSKATLMTGGAYVASYRCPEIMLASGSRFTAKGQWTGPPYVGYA